MNEFFQRLKQRKIVQWTLAYVAAAFALLQGIDIIAQRFGWPEQAMRIVIIALTIGLFVTLVLAWYHGERGAQRVTGAELVILALLLAVGGGFLWRLAATSREPKSQATAVYKDNQVSQVPAAIPEKSIAVLPFENLSDDKTNAYFANGIQDEILTRLAKIGQLKVISRTSTQQYQSKPGSLSDIAKQLGVAHILEGSVQKSANSVRVNVQLIKAEGDSHLWAETYDRALTDVFAVETEVAERIASSLEARLTGREQEQVADIPTKSAAAYDAYLRALALLNQQGSAPIESAIEYLTSAISLDPKYAQAWAQLAIAEAQKSGYERTAAQVERARNAAETAVRLQPQSGETHEGLAAYYYYGLRDFDRALAEMEKARSYSPNSAEVILYIGLIKRRQGRLDEAIDDIRRAATLDPRNSDTWVNLSGSYRGKRDFRSALEAINRALAISPNELDIAGYKAEIYFAQGDLDGGEAVLRGLKLEPGHDSVYEHIYSLLCRRQYEEAIAVFAATDDSAAHLSALRATRRRELRGEIHSLAGHVEEARALLEQTRTELIAFREHGNSSADILSSLVLVNAFLRDRTQLDRCVETLLAETAADKWQVGLSQAIVATSYAQIGDADRALPMIVQALAARCDSSLTVANLQHPVWDPIRNDPRFGKLVAADPNASPNR